MHFDITSKHLLHGMPRSETCCPALLAIQDQLPGCSVLCDGVNFFIDGKTYQVPEDLVAWQGRFDGPERHKAGPMRFELLI